MPATKEEALAEYQAAVAALEADIPSVPRATPASHAARQAREAADEAARQAREAAKEAEQAYHSACAAAREAAAEAARQARNESRVVHRLARDEASTLKRDKAALWLAYRQACATIDQTPIPPRWPSREELAQRVEADIRRQVIERAAADEEARAARQAEIDRYNASLRLK